MWFFAPSTFLLVLVSSVLGNPIDTANIGSSNVANISSIDVVNASSIDAGALGPTCTRAREFLRFDYRLNIPHLPKNRKISKVCDLLWLYLSQKSMCTVSSPHGCGAVNGGNNTLEWWFHTSTLCNTGMVENAFWLATSKNAYGEVKCKKE